MNESGKEEAINDTLAILRKAWEESPFNRFLGFKVDHVNAREGQISFATKPELIGNFYQGILHGGVISAVIDAAEGLAAYASALSGIKDLQRQEATDRLAKTGTIDMRVDYLRPGKSIEFRCVATVMRTGAKVAVSRMELFERENNLIAVGTGAYLVG